MEIAQAHCQAAPNAGELASLTRLDPHLVLVFGSVSRMTDAALPALLREQFPRAQLVGCSTAGEIVGSNVFDEDRKSTRLNSSHSQQSRMPSSA